MASRNFSRKMRVSPKIARFLRKFPFSMIRHILWQVAWLSILLGIGINVLSFIFMVSLGSAISLPNFAASLVHQITWFFLVCTGLVLGKILAKHRVALAGFAGLLAAPIANFISNAAHQSVLQALVVVGTMPTGPSTIFLAMFRAVEYGCLGLLLAWAELKGAKLKVYLALGLCVGLLFGSTTFYLRLQPVPAFAPAWIALELNEILVPMSCALVFGMVIQAMERR